MTPEYMKADGKLYQLVNHYCLPDDGWSVELTEMGENGGGLLHVLIPDEDADRPCEVHIESDTIPLEVRCQRGRVSVVPRESPLILLLTGT